MKWIVSLIILAATTRPATQSARVWGEAVEGVTVSLRAEQQVYRRGEVPRFDVSARNGGKRSHLRIPLSQEMWAIEVDGKRYQQFGDAEVTSKPLPPGERIDHIAIALQGDWAPLDRDNHTRLKLAPGKHTLRVILTADTTHPAESDVQATSNPVEFHIVETRAR